MSTNTRIIDFNPLLKSLPTAIENITVNLLSANNLEYADQLAHNVQLMSTMVDLYAAQDLIHWLINTPEGNSIIFDWDDDPNNNPHYLQTLADSDGPDLLTKINKNDTLKLAWLNYSMDKSTANFNTLKGCLAYFKTVL